MNEGLSAKRLVEIYGSPKDALRYLRDPYKQIWAGKLVHFYWSEAMDTDKNKRRREVTRRLKIIQELEAME